MPLEDAATYLSVTDIAQRWGSSTDKASRILEKYRGKSGFMDLGSSGNVRKCKRKYAIIRISASLLDQIESDLNGSKAS